MQTLYVHFENQIVGTLNLDNDEKLGFTYTNEWIQAQDRFPISLALPLEEGVTYSHNLTKSYFENLIPEGDLRRIFETKFQVPEGDDFHFLAQFGRDCAGALVISPSAELSSTEDNSKDKIKISIEELESHIKSRESLVVLLSEKKENYFSLAGAQDKIPIIYSRRMLYLPTKSAPTTHILKPPARHLAVPEDSVYNEYFCMQLAKKVGLDVPAVEIIGKNLPLYLIQRFDRQEIAHGVKRIHQQDLCQAKGLPSSKKYEVHGGPSFAACYQFIRQNSQIATKDLSRLLNWLFFNLLIGNNDSHSKNLSFLLSDGGIKLSPFYDLLSTQIYPAFTSNFAFKIGGQNEVQKLRRKNFSILAQEIEEQESVVFTSMERMIDKVLANIEEMRGQFEKQFPVPHTAKKIHDHVISRANGFRQTILHPLG